MPGLGDLLQFRTDIRDDAGTLVNATAVVLTVTLPDGSTATPAVANPPAVTGKYIAGYQTVAAGLSGRYVGKFLATFAGGATTEHEESFDVGAGVISVGEALAHLRAAKVITAADDVSQLEELILVATDAIERDLDCYLVRRTVTATVSTARPSVWLRGPVVSVTSVTVDGTPLDSAAYSVGDYGRLSFRAGWSTPGPATVTYVAGYADPPRSVRHVAKTLVQALWQTSQQAPHPFYDESGAEQAVAGAVTGLPDVLRGAYKGLKLPGVA